jgi:hypothetical protein
MKCVEELYKEIVGTKEPSSKFRTFQGGSVPRRFHGMGDENQKLSPTQKVK